MDSSHNNGNRDLSRPPKDLMDVTVGSGRWQILVTLMLSFSMFTHLLNTGTETLLRPSGWWCKMPDFLDDWTDVQWILYSHSKDSCVGICNRDVWTPEILADGYFQGCKVYDTNYDILKGLSYSERPRIETNETIPCPYGVYYSTTGGQSLAEKFKRGCFNGTIQSSLWLSSSTFGRIGGYILFGALGDWIGRKFVIFIACGITPVTALIVATSPDYSLFVIASAVHGFFHGGFAMCMVLIIEISTNSWRTGLLAISCGCFALGIGLTPVINNVFGSYDQMIVFINMLCVVVFVSARFLPESPVWLFCIRDTSRLEKIIMKAAEVNQRSLGTNFHLIYVEYSTESHNLPEGMPRIWNLLLHQEVACQVIGITYLTALFALIFGGAYYAILANVAKSQLANSLLVAATTGGMLFGQLCILMMGHRRVLRISISLVLVSSLVLMIRLHDSKPSVTGPTTTLLLVNVSMVSLSYGVLLNYNTRTFPTLLRGTLYGMFCATWAIFVWVGNHDYIKFPRVAIVLVMSCLIAALFSMNLRDLYRRELPDTMLDCITFGVQAKPKRWDITESTEDSLCDEIRYVSMEKPSWHLDCVALFSLRRVTLASPVSLSFPLFLFPVALARDNARRSIFDEEVVRQRGTQKRSLLVTTSMTVSSCSYSAVRMPRSDDESERRPYQRLVNHRHQPSFTTTFSSTSAASLRCACASACLSSWPTAIYDR